MNRDFAVDSITFQCFIFGFHEQRFCCGQYFLRHFLIPTLHTTLSLLSVQILKLHFPHDLCVNEVKRLLNSSQPVKIALEQKPEVR